MALKIPLRPAQSREVTERILSDHGVDLAKPALLGSRGYFRDSMGVIGRNDRGIYDDAIFLVTPTAFVSFNANCDPSVARDGIASLEAGHVYLYRIGIHGLSKPANQQYEALVQAGEVWVQRDGGKREKGYFGINIHRGGLNTTSSLGCQTIHPSQWAAFITLVDSELSRHGAKTIPYLLLAYQGGTMP